MPRIFPFCVLIALIATPLCYGPTTPRPSLLWATANERPLAWAPKKSKNCGRRTKQTPVIFFDVEGKNVCSLKHNPRTCLLALFAQTEVELTAPNTDKENGLPGASSISPIPGGRATLPFPTTTPSPIPDPNAMPVDTPAQPASSTPTIQACISTTDIANGLPDTLEAMGKCTLTS